MISKFILSSAFAAVALSFGAASASADWDRPPPGYGAPPHRFEAPRYREGFNRPWWRRDEWRWRRGHARWDDRGPPPPRRDWRYD
jgi:hypothetical protein